MDKSKLKNLISSLKNARVLVIGDLILDRYLYGRVERLSPEAPVPVLDYQKEEFILGGATNVAHNISTLGGNVSVCGLTGDDEHALIFHDLLKKVSIDTSGLISDASRPTTVKTRVIGDRQQLVRIDREKRHDVSGEALDCLKSFLSENFANFNAIVISDYGKGVVTTELLAFIRELATEHKIPVVVDPKDTHFSNYKGFTVITPNLTEASLGAGFKIKDEETLLEAGKTLLALLDCASILITRGSEGMSLFRTGEKLLNIPTRARGVFDVSGAGDTVVATIALSLASGLAVDEAAHLANWAAGVVVAKHGTATVNIDELKAYIDRFAD
jgi:D-beta-D-heptose 7-phosphate kinase/D-beta-D-heptose 1-phosphate adenosyltransferase